LQHPVQRSQPKIQAHARTPLHRQHFKSGTTLTQILLDLNKTTPTFNIIKLP